METLKDELRRIAKSARVKPIELSIMINLLNSAADHIENVEIQRNRLVKGKGHQSAEWGDGFVLD